MLSRCALLVVLAVAAHRVLCNVSQYGHEGGMAEHGGGPFHFIAELSPQMREEFFAIVTNGNLTKQEIKDDLSRWAAQNATVNNAYLNFTKFVENAEAALSSDAHLYLQGVALDTFLELLAIYKDDTLTRRAECRKIFATVNATQPRIALAFVPKEGMVHCEMMMVMEMRRRHEEVESGKATTAS